MQAPFKMVDHDFYLWPQLGQPRQRALLQLPALQAQEQRALRGQTSWQQLLKMSLAGKNCG